ncbi:MAG: phosphoglycerate dehydrogenase [Anaerolineae bacterium]
MARSTEEMTKAAERRPRILVADPLSEAGLRLLGEEADVDTRYGLKPDELAQIISEYDALIVRSGVRVTADIIRAGRRLRVIGRAGVGIDNIDVDAATQAGIIVVNAPTGNVVAAAEHAIALLLALARNIPQADASMRRGEWDRRSFMGVEVQDKTLGILGLGRIGSLVATRAQGLQMKVLGYDPYVSEDYAAKLSVELVSLDELLARSDFISLHLPLTDSTRKLLNRETLAKCKRGVRIINCARGGVIDHDALLEALESGQVAGAALDVYDPEPLDKDHPLRRHPNVVLTPHIAGSTTEAQERVALDVAEQVLSVLKGGLARNAVNVPILPPQAMDALIPYIELAERMGHFAAQFEQPNVEQIEITAQGGIAEYDMSYVTAAVLKGLLQDVVDERVNFVNATLIASRRGLKVVERKQRHPHERYENMLTLRLMVNGTSLTIRGSILQGVPHIVAIDDLWVAFPAAGYLLLDRHEDRPGVIGRLGTLLGENDINIAFMHVGRRAPRGKAIMVLGLDERVPETLLEQIKQMPYTYWVKFIELDPAPPQQE